MVRITPIYKPLKGHLEGVPQPYLGDLLNMVINHVSKSWDDPPSGQPLRHPGSQQVFSGQESFVEGSFE